MPWPPSLSRRWPPRAARHVAKHPALDHSAFTSNEIARLAVNSTVQKAIT